MQDTRPSRKARIHRWLATLASGAMMLQTSGCTQALTTTIAISSVITAGGVIYIVTRIIRD